MAYRERQKISQMTPKGADLSTTDLVEVSVLESGSYVTKSVTGLQIINAASGGALDLQAVTDNGNTTTNYIEVTDGTDTSVINKNQIITFQMTGSGAALNASGSAELINGATNGIGILAVTNVNNANVTLEFPNKATGSYTIATTSDLTSGYIPYTGATQNADLGEYELKAGQISLDTTPTQTPVVSSTYWNDSDGITQTLLKGGSVTLKNGIDLVARVVNKVVPNATLTKANYTAVKISGAQGQRLAVDYAKADIDLNSADTIGLVTETIATNQEGFVITVGQLEDINTTGSLQGETWADGDVLYLSPTTAGALTNIKPNGSTGHIVVIGYVEYAHAVHGKIYVKIMNGWELDELHNVYIDNGTLANNDALIYDSSTQLWKNKTIATALGYTPVSSVGATAPLTSSGGASPTISTSMATNKLIGRSTAGTGVMEEITVGTGLTLSAGTLSASSGLQYFTEAQNTSTPNATVPVDSLTAVASTTNADFAIIPKGDGALTLDIPDNTATGGNKRGTRAIDLQLIRAVANQIASGNDSVCLGQNNIASALYSLAIGRANNSNGNYAVCIGNSNVISGSSVVAVAIGTSNTVSNDGYALGQFNTINANDAIGLGARTTNNSVIGRLCFASGRHSVNGDAQRSIFVLRAATTGNALTTVTTNGLAASTNNQVILNNQSAYGFTGTIVGKEQGNTNAAMWKIEGLIARGTNAASTILTTSTVTLVSNAPGWGAPTLAANTTNGALQVQVIGAVATNIQWTVNIETTESIYA